jgi:RNA polymerase sigma-32 factor
VKLDPFYRRLLASIPTMSAEDQRTVAKRYAVTRDRRDADRLVLGNLRLVLKIACELGAHYRGDLMDSIQEGTAGLTHAVRRFDPKRGVKLSSYASWWIRAYIKQHMRETSRIARFASTREGRRRYSDRTLPGHDISLDAPVRRHGDHGSVPTPLLDIFVADDQDRPDVRVEEQEYRSTLQRAVAAFRPHLDERGRCVLDMRLLRDEPARLADVGKRFGISGERARQLETRVRDGLRTFVAERLSPSPGRAAA